MKIGNKKKKENALKSQWQLKVKTSKLPKARENAGDGVVNGFNFGSDWLRKWLWTNHRAKYAKPKQSLGYFQYN